MGGPQFVVTPAPSLGLDPGTVRAVSTATQAPASVLCPAHPPAAPAMTLSVLSLIFQLPTKATSDGGFVAAFASVANLNGTVEELLPHTLGLDIFTLQYGWLNLTPPWTKASALVSAIRTLAWSPGPKHQHPSAPCCTVLVLPRVSRLHSVPRS